MTRAYKAVIHKSDVKVGAFVYAIGRDEEFVKFGVATDPKKRLAGIMTGCPVDVEILSAMHCGARATAFELERLIHAAMNKHYLRGEWFKWHTHTAQVVARLKSHDSRELRSFLNGHLKTEDCSDAEPRGEAARIREIMRVHMSSEVDLIGANGLPSRRRFQ